MQNGEQLVKSYLPMSEASFLVLFSLKEPLHGYGIMQRVSELTGGRVNLGAGTVYTILYKMECDGLMESVSVVERRKVYRITETGQKILSAEQMRLRQLCAIMDKTQY